MYLTNIVPKWMINASFKFQYNKIIFLCKFLK